MTMSDVVRARLFLLRAAQTSSPALHDFIAARGAVEAVQRIRGGAAPSAVTAELTHQDVDIDDDIELIDTGAARLVTPEDGDWPAHRFSRPADTEGRVPLALWVRGTGSLADLTRIAVTITGARFPTGYGTYVTAELVRELAAAKVTILSGGAFGIDETAHRAALANSTPTVVVLPCGIDQDHPREHATLFARVIEHHGLLVSQHPTGTQITKKRSALRNRLVAALTQATVLVEASRNSAVLTTARTARVLGRRVYGVPGPITSSASAGVNDLLNAGVATAISTAGQIDYLHEELPAAPSTTGKE